MQDQRMTANPLRGEAALIIGEGDGERFLTLVFDYEAMIVAEATYGEPIGVVSDHADRGFVGAIRAMLFGTLRAHHPEIDLAEATHICFTQARAVKAAMDEAARNSMPPPQGEEERDEARPRRAGTRSGASGAKQGSTPKASSARPRARSRSSSPRG
jgi:hypothetical protein